MAVMQNSLIFGGVNSADYGIYISGEGVFNAPKRDVEMISIPGRNGTFALDKGRFENIEVTYPAITFEPGDYDTFARNLADFRNAICSQRGYQRLTDTFHPEEYRMATYIGGLDIKPIKYNTASQFNLVFDCKPQRWLMSGEAAVDVSDGDTLLNPTLFESSPLLEVEGLGTIAFNGYEIDFDNGLFGDTTLLPVTTITRQSATFSLPSDIYASGDAMTFDGASVNWNISARRAYLITDATVSASSGATTSIVSRPSLMRLKLKTIFDGVTFPAGTDYTDEATVTIQIDGGGGSTASLSVQITFSYNASNQTFNFSFRTTATPTGYSAGNESTRMKELSVDSTVYALGHPTYIDCDLGDAYKIENGKVISLNSHIDLGSELPKLIPGINTISFDNTITELKVHPRWWKV